MIQIAVRVTAWNNEDSNEDSDGNIVNESSYRYQVCLSSMTNLDLSNAAPISLARVPDHCFFSVEHLADHDYHTPTFLSRSDVLGYIRRIMKDITVSLIAIDVVNIAPEVNLDAIIDKAEKEGKAATAIFGA